VDHFFHELLDEIPEASFRWVPQTSPNRSRKDSTFFYVIEVLPIKTGENVLSFL
jgi:hypothetical protein